MFRIDRETNEIRPLEACSFSDKGFKERDHLQEWIAKHPSCLGEDLLIIQKEFSGFLGTRERPDLLALDKEGCIVIIENKLDDTGRDVTWQSLKYASYCAGLKNDDICAIFQDYLHKNGQEGDAKKLISEFLQEADLSEVTLNRSFTQRIILIAARFRKEVTSTVLWLMNFKLRLQCFKVTPWSMEDDLFLNVEQIIPVKDTQEFVIGLADKAQEEVQKSSVKDASHAIRREFWTDVIRSMKEKSKLYDKITPGGYNWIGASSGLPGVGYNFAASGKYGRAEVYIDRGKEKDSENKFIFDCLSSDKEQLETNFGGLLVWERMEDSRACRIKAEIEANVFDRNEWPRMIDFMTDAMVRIEKVFHDPLQKLNGELRSRSANAETDESASVAK